MLLNNIRMGRGGFALAPKAAGCLTSGYDYAEKRQALGREMGIKMLPSGEVSDATFELTSFGFINTEQVFEHLPNPGCMAKLLIGALKPGGILKISVPFSRSDKKGNLESDWKQGRYASHSPTPLQPLEHLQYYRRPSLELLREHLGVMYEWLRKRLRRRRFSFAHQR